MINIKTAILLALILMSCAEVQNGGNVASAIRKIMEKGAEENPEILDNVIYLKLTHEKNQKPVLEYIITKYFRGSGTVTYGLNEENFSYGYSKRLGEKIGLNISFELRNVHANPILLIENQRVPLSCIVRKKEGFRFRGEVKDREEACPCKDCTPDGVLEIRAEELICFAQFD